MNRDMDLCRRVLLAIEDSPPSKTVQFFNFAGAYPKDTVAEHVVLLFFRKPSQRLSPLSRPLVPIVLFAIADVMKNRIGCH